MSSDQPSCTAHKAPQTATLSAPSGTLSVAVCGALCAVLTGEATQGDEQEWGGGGWELLFDQAEAAKEQQRNDDAQELFGRAGVAAEEEVGDTAMAVACYINQASCLLPICYAPPVCCASPA